MKKVIVFALFVLLGFTTACESTEIEPVSKDTPTDITNSQTTINNREK